MGADQDDTLKAKLALTARWKLGDLGRRILPGTSGGQGRVRVAPHAPSHGASPGDGRRWRTVPR